VELTGVTPSVEIANPADRGWTTMRSITAVLSGVALSSFLTACGVTRPTWEQIESADYGKPPEAFNYQDTIKNSMGLFDPYSAVWSFWAPYKGHFNKTPIQGGQPVYGYWVEGSVNAKNRFGAYTGVKAFRYLMHNELIYGPCHQVSSPFIGGEAWYCN
jgi:hypothetical protein